MTKSTRLLTATALALLISSCGSGSDSAPEPSASFSEPAMADAGPFAAAEMTMKDKMDTAIGANISDTWLAQMIEHHRGAIAMSEIVLGQDPSSDVRKMAEETIAKQGKEIDDLTKLRSSGVADPASIEPYRTAGMEMHQAMIAATGGDISETYLRKMLAHHRGAVALSDVVIAQGTDSRVRAAAQKTRAGQAKEAAMIEAMLAGKPMAMATSATPMPRADSGTPPRAAPVAQRPAPSPAKPRPATSRPTPAPTASASAPGHDMKDMPGMKM